VKPLPAAPLTEEDLAIWVNYRGEARRAYGMGWYLPRSRESDRRDADLMLQAQRHPISVAIHWVTQQSSQRIALRGRDGNRAAAQAHGLDITGCA
jgi:hypothetical protein